ncbi:hypothetical protein [Ferruginibacter sp. SUN106]|uniref:hypothetical protein n=1 Tax=Ferruginibacter sp. SUN106 TaxID=2978348 RepID=UPI003D36DD4F
MAENSLLQNLYADLTDQQIIYKILHESDQLTPEALTVAKEELAKRNINIEQLTIAKETEEIQEKEYANFKLTKTTGELIDFFKIITTAKEEGKSDTAIVNEFKKQGIDDRISVSLIKEAKQQCKDKLDKIQADLFYGLIIAAAGTAIVFFSERFSKGSIIVLPYGAMFYGLFRLLKGLSDLPLQKKLKAVIKSF